MWKSRNTRCIFSPAEGGAFSPTSSTESGPSAPLKSKTTNSESLPQDSLTCQSGMTCGRSAPTIQNAPVQSKTCAGTPMSLSFPADFLVRIFQAREKAQELAVRGADFGKSTRVSFARYDRDSCSWRIPHCLFPGDWGLYSQTWPRWGIMVHGECFQLPPWALGIGEIVSGDYSGVGGHEVMSWPTPMKHDMRGVSRGQRARDELQCAVEIGRTKSRATYPTPTVCGNNNNNITGDGMGLGTLVKVIEGVECRQTVLPTPCATDYKGPGSSGTPLDRLDYAIERGQTKSNTYPTPRALSLCGGTGAFEKIQANENLTEGEKKALSSTGGRLNPDWVEWLMGFPVGWTDIELDNGAPFPWLGLSDDPADAVEPSIRRITTRQQHRAHRIETLGNGQVPLCAAVAFNFAFEILRMALGTFKRKDQE